MLNRKSPPSFQLNTKFDLLTPERLTLPNGAEVIILAGGEQEVLKLELVFNSGRWFEPQQGISYFAGTQLLKGTEHYNSFQISNVFDFYGVHVEVLPGFDFTSVVLYGMSKHIPSVLSLLSDILQHACYPQHELQQGLAIYRQNLHINLEKTSYLASRAFRERSFGKDHPYGYDLDENAITAVTTDTLNAFRKDYYRDFVAVLSGKIPEEIKREIFNTLGQLPCSPQGVPEHVMHPQTGHYQHIEKEDAVQTSLRFGKMIVGRTHEDYAAVLLLNHLLGGFFGSRLMKNIREEKGLTYGIHSSIQALKNATYFVIGADVNRENRQLTIDEVKREIGQLSNEPVGQEELTLARNHFIGSLQTEMNTPFAHADKHKVLHLFDLPGNYFQQLIDKMLRVNPSTLQEIANQYFAEDDLMIVSAG